MNANSNPQWGSSYRLIASEKWKAKSAAMGRDVTEALVEYARPKPGMKVLDLASGTGEPAISLAARVGSEGHVIALDLSGDLLEIARKRAEQRGFTNFVTQQADAHELPFSDQSFDLVTSRFGVMFFEDCEKALGEAHRVLKPGARACFLAWGPFEQPYWSSTMGIVARHVGGPPLFRADRIPSSLPGQEVCRRYCGWQASAVSKREQSHCHGPGQEQLKKSGSRRRQ